MALPIAEVDLTLSMGVKNAGAVLEEEFSVWWAIAVGIGSLLALVRPGGGVAAPLSGC
jgi:hypothetical protein